MYNKLMLDKEIIAVCHAAAKNITADVSTYLGNKTTVSVERTILRFLGVDGVDDFDLPYVNILVNHVHDNGALGKGIAYWLGNAMIHTGKSAQEIAEMTSSREIDLLDIPRFPESQVRSFMECLCHKHRQTLKQRQEQRSEFKANFPAKERPYVYVLTATGNVYEDVTHGLAVAENGGDIIAVIRSTAQSLYDFVPHGATTEGFGGTFATQENFRIMREALDNWANENNRYMMLSSFCSGLCMAEIAAMGVMEGLDNMVNDAMYGILYRDINMVRTLIDQDFSRRINGYFGIVINTGEDNYLRTSDSPTTPASIVASEMINYYFALNSGVPESLMGIGNAFEIHPDLTNGLLYEWAQAQLTRELFPNCPVKYMPPTKHMDGNLFRTHACDALFNLITVATQQGIQTIGVPTEGVFTPHIHDRVLGLENTRYVFNFAKNLGDEIQFKPDGIIQKHAQNILKEASEILIEMAETGLFHAIENRVFGNVSRSIDDGKGREGIAEKDQDYFNPFIELLRS